MAGFQLSTEVHVEPAEQCAARGQAFAAGGLLVNAIDALARLPLSPSPQPETGVTYAAKIEKAEALIDWRQISTTVW